MIGNKNFFWLNLIFPRKISKNKFDYFKIRFSNFLLQMYSQNQVVTKLFPPIKRHMVGMW